MPKNKRETKRNFLKSQKLKNRIKDNHLIYDLDPQLNISSFGEGQHSSFSGYASIFLQICSKYYKKVKESILRKKNERLTIMFIPHNEDKIKNFNISNLVLIITLCLVGSFIAFGSILIVNHTSTVQQVDNLQISQEDSKIQFTKIREEIISASKSHEKLKELLFKIGNLTGKQLKGGAFTALGGPGVDLEELDEKKIQELREFENRNSESGQSISQEENEDEENIPYTIFILNRILNDTRDVDDHLDNLDGYIKRNLKSIRNSPTLWPVKGYIINPYGFVRKTDQLKANFNTGVDIVSLPGAKVLATAPGYLKQITRGKNGLFTVRVRHHYGYETVYSGLAHISVEKNAALSKGEEIGYLGSNGALGSNTLHYQIYIGIEAQNPLSYLTYPKE